jgi:hypothetical protein
MTSEHYLREIAELLREMNQRLARMHELLVKGIPNNRILTAAAREEWPKELWHNQKLPDSVLGLASDQASYDWMTAHGWEPKE